jgi:hypothetical protein
MPDANPLLVVTRWRTRAEEIWAQAETMTEHRGLFRRDYEGTTLREHLGLPRPQNHFFAN